MANPHRSSGPIIELHHDIDGVDDMLCINIERCLKFDAFTINGDGIAFSHSVHNRYVISSGTQNGTIWRVFLGLQLQSFNYGARVQRVNSVLLGISSQPNGWVTHRSYSPITPSRVGCNRPGWPVARGAGLLPK